MDAKIRTCILATSLAIAIALALAPRFVGAAPDSPHELALDTAPPDQRQPVQFAVTAPNVGAVATTGVPVGNRVAVAHKKSRRTVGEPLASLAKPDPAGPSFADVRSRAIATDETHPAPHGPLRLTLTPEQMQTIIAKYQTKTGSNPQDRLDEITVRAPAELQPMLDPARDVWGGIGAPLWALLHPTQAWRIFLPIPPK